MSYKLPYFWPKMPYECYIFFPQCHIFDQTIWDPWSKSNSQIPTKSLDFLTLNNMTIYSAKFNSFSISRKLKPKAMLIDINQPVANTNSERQAAAPKYPKEFGRKPIHVSVCMKFYSKSFSIFTDLLH